MTKEFGRRDFLKMAGLGSAVGAGALAASAALPKKAKAEYNQPASFGVNMSVRYVDTPSYNLPPYADADKLARFDENYTSFNHPELSKQAFGGQPFYIPYTEAKIRSAKEGIKGTLRDNAFAEGSDANEALSQLHEWATDYSSPFVEALGKWEDTPENNSRTVKKAALFYGAGAVGICKLNEQWLYTRTTRDNNKTIRLTDEVTKPTITETEHLIPKTMDNVIVMLVPLDGAIGKFTPTLIGGTTNLGYSKMSELVAKMAKFLRELGYNATGFGNHEALSIPLAIDAGLGELGRHGVLINPEFGSFTKICKVFTDLPLAPDKPIQFGAVEFCKTCKKCAEVCPSKSISMAPEPSYDIQCPSNNPGMKKWYVNTWNCLKLWVDGGAECNTCIRACTYSKPQTWVHDVIKVTTSKTTLFNSIFAKMDNAFGYGVSFDQLSNADTEAWWNSDDDRMFNWLKM